MRDIKPQKGPQEDFLSTSADIAIYGGAAGAGKSFALLMEPLRHIDNNKFGAVCFRRESPQITSQGGLWDTSFELYSSYDARPIQSPSYHWQFKNGSTITFSHIQHEKNVKSWDGSQIPLLMFDELQHFTAKQFFYMLSRNRSTCGVKPYIRATCNPDPDSFLRDLLSWWINQETGFPIKERSGVIRWFIRKNNIIHWASSKQGLIDKFPGSKPKSLTFIPGNIEDNPALLKMDEGYVGNLEALLEYEQKRLLHGNWFARPNAGELFKRFYFKVIERSEAPTEYKEDIRYWDRAATVPNDENPDPDYTVGLKMAVGHDDNYYITDIIRDRVEPGDVENLIKSGIELDDYDTVIGLEQEPGASGKIEVANYQNNIDDRNIELFPKSKSKLTCWKPAARYAKNKFIYIIKAPWNEAFLSEAESVTDGSQKGHDDQIDCLAGAYNYLEGGEGSYTSTINVF